MNDEQIMLEALKLSLRGSGYVNPNPRVGAVIVSDGEIIGRGWHREFGAPHAEVEAINNAGRDSFEGATLFTNLEPCSFEGKTPPCASLIAEKKFSKVVIGMIDPNPEVSGKGVEILEESGIEVVQGVLEDECQWVNRFFVKFISTGLPYVMVKAAQSLDGCIATARGESKWISGEESRNRTQAMRAEVDAVLVGKHTVSIDRPGLTVRDVKGRSPKRIIFDSNLSLPLGISPLEESDRSNTIICCNKVSHNSRKAETLGVAGITVLPVPCNENGKIEISSALLELSEKCGITSIMVEGGAEIFSSFAEAGVIDELHLFIAPIVMGKGQSTFGQLDTGSLKSALKYDIKSFTRSGDDIHLVMIRNETGQEE